MEKKSEKKEARGKEKLLKYLKPIITIAIILVLAWLLFIYPYISFKSNEKTLKAAGEHYFEINPDKLPTGSRVKTITLKELYQSGYINGDMYMPYTKETCSLDNSWVKAKTDNGEYEYYTYLECGTLKSKTDHTGPKIILNGEKEMTLTNGDEYKEPGVKSVKDNTDGTMSIDGVQIDSSKVDTIKNGTYKVTYTIKDSFGNETVETRTITVIQPIKSIVKKATKNGKYVGITINNNLRFSNMMFKIIGIDGENIKITTAEDISNVNYDGIEEWLEVFYEHLSDESKQMIVKEKYCNEEINKDKIEKYKKCNSTTKKKDIYILSADDINNSFDENGNSYLLGESPIKWLANSSNEKTAWTTRNRYDGTNSKFMEFDKNYNFGIRPVIVIKGDELVKSGNGTYENPYSFEETKKAKPGDLINTRYSGEYIEYSGYIFRIIEPTTEGTTKIISNGTIPLNISYNTADEAKIYNPKQKGNIGYQINNKTPEYIKADYFVSSEITVPIYKDLVKYNQETSTKKYKVTFAAPDMYEMFAASSTDSKTYWLINSSKKQYVKSIISATGVPIYEEISDSQAAQVKVVGYLNSKCKILDGSGTYNDPYTIVK